jgi:hypothetical protein
VGEVHFRLSEALLERLDEVAAVWSTSRSGAIRKLIETADVDGLEPLGVPDMEELTRIAAEKARGGNMAAVSFLAARQPDEREREFERLLERLGAGDQ